MKRADQREYPFDGEFTMDQLDWSDMPTEKIEAGLADLVAHGFLIKTSRRAYRLSFDRNDRNTEKADTLFRNIWKLTPVGQEVFVSGMMSPDKRRLMTIVFQFADGAALSSREAIYLMDSIEAVYEGDVAAAADDLRDGKLTLVRQWAH